MKPLLGALAGVAIFASSAMAEDCVAPEAPTVPDRFETEEELMAVYGEVKTFVTEKSVAYLECLDKEIGAINPDADNADERKAALEEAYNDNVDTQNAVNNRFKAAYGVWKKENP